MNPGNQEATHGRTREMDVTSHKQGVNKQAVKNTTAPYAPLSGEANYPAEARPGKCIIYTGRQK
jgi:hypothetical protein